MIIGIGSDIARIARFEQAMARHGPRFSQRILSHQERLHLTDAARPAAYLAKRFAAKEAFVKALGLGLRQGMRWTQIEVLNDALGKPVLRLSGTARALSNQAGVSRLHVSLSDESSHALAFVILESDV